MRGSGVGLVSREEVNSRWFCLESGFTCFVGRSLCYQSLLGTEYSFHTRAHNKSIVQGAYGAALLSRWFYVYSYYPLST